VVKSVGSFRPRSFDRNRAQPAESVTALIQHRKSVFSGNRTYWIGRPIARIAKKVVAPDTSCMVSSTRLPSTT